jgi:hypothetical protein
MRGGERREVGGPAHVKAHLPSSASITRHRLPSLPPTALKAQRAGPGGGRAPSVEMTPAMAAAVAAREAADALKALELADAVPSDAFEECESAEGGSPAKGGRNGAARGPRAAQLWGVARAAMRSGRLKNLFRSEAYSLVGAVFSALFPDDFDRVVPVFNFRETDLLMRRW